MIVTNKPTSHLVPKCLWVVPACTFLRMTSSNLRPRIRSIILGRKQMRRLRCGAQIQEASRQQNQASKSLNRCCKGGSSDSNDTFKWAKTVLLLTLSIPNIFLFLMRIWPGYASMITLWILLLQAIWPKGSALAATELQISHHEDGNHWLDGCSKICVVGGYSSGTLEGGRMGDGLHFFSKGLGLVLVFWSFY